MIKGLCKLYFASIKDISDELHLPYRVLLLNVFFCGLDSWESTQDTRVDQGNEPTKHKGYVLCTLEQNAILLTSHCITVQGKKKVSATGFNWSDLNTVNLTTAVLKCHFN